MNRFSDEEAMNQFSNGSIDGSNIPRNCTFCHLVFVCVCVTCTRPLGIYCFTVGVSACAFARGRSRLEWSHARWFYSCFIVPDRSCLGALCTLCVACDVRVFMCIYVCRKG